MTNHNGGGDSIILPSMLSVQSQNGEEGSIVDGVIRI